MMNYIIPTENGKTGHTVNNLQAQINLGLKKGYEGFIQEKQEVLNFLTDLYKKAITDNKPFLPFVVTDTVITYAYPTDNGPVGAHEPALLLVSDKSPLYYAGTDDDWKELVEQYAAQLAERFQQFRVYVTYDRVETIIFQQA